MIVWRLENFLFIKKKVSLKTLFLVKETKLAIQNKTFDQSVVDWRLFDFNSIQKFNFSNRNGRYKVVSIERQCFKDFTNLEVINLNKNELTKIVAHSFQNLNKLKKLSLEGNDLEQIDSNVFQGLGNLEELDLG